MPKETLKDIATRLRGRLRDAAREELDVAVEVMKLANAWADYESEHNGKRIGVWLKEQVDPTRSLAWYKDRATAQRLLGAGLTARLEGPAAVWLAHAVSESDLPSVREVLGNAYRMNRSIPLKQTQLKRLCRAFVQPTSDRYRDRASAAILQARVDQLEAQIRSMGGKPLPWPEDKAKAG